MTANVDALSALGLTAQQDPRTKKTELGEADFLTLLVSQLKNQDPLKPMDQTAFVGQLAQFSEVAGIQSMNTSFSGLSSSLQASQALQGATLIGRDVLAPGHVAALGASGAVNGAFDLPQDSSAVTVQVVDANGNTIRTLALGAQDAGTGNFTWDGNTDAGSRAAAGNYTIKVSAEQDGKATSLAPLVAAQVQTVTLGSSGLILNLAGTGAVALADVRQIF